MPSKKDYWFPAKTYGWDWGLPSVWQGWLVYGIAFVLLVAGFFIFPPRAEPVFFQIHIWAVLLILVAICWVKGEPPRWRWGK
ncbi:hypothetical protein WCN79_01305 [Xanthomonas axonopodis pv. vasculorum]|uniref:hypothetical protein n=1 Tax=Xanthomonas axonopodis TaxID=53413 RepID=UPI000D4151F0|nr:hypothetical protein [Xanthomonas axonopodis]PPV08458.1 hypothetical protein XavaCFBP5823_17550 [Xanthomonas axonopodis pv. vasculorum]QKD85223.1 hypothetical protein XAV_00360 [Xanthomonas axonopodis pv. vasculorum]